jgi:DNA-binding protein HU-beta
LIPWWALSSPSLALVGQSNPKHKGHTMSRAKLVDAIRTARPELTIDQSADVLNAVLEAIVDSVQAGDSVVLAGFGSFTHKISNARTCRNPSTGEPVQVPAKATIRFKPSKALVVEG